MNFVVRVFSLVVLVVPNLLQAASPVQACVAASEAGQRAQRAGQLLSARSSFEQCAAPSCPSLVAADCTRWLDEVIAATPSLVIIVRLDAVDQPRARVLLDGQPWLEALTGRAMDLEPGAHRLRVELEGRVQERALLVFLSEKNRPIVFHFESPPPAVVKPAPSRPLGWPWAVTGVALAGWGAFATLGLLGRANLEAMTKSACGLAKTCAPSQVAEIRSLFLAADVSLGVATVATAVAGLLWWRGLSQPVVSVAPVPGGVGLSLSGTW